MTTENTEADPIDALLEGEDPQGILNDFRLLRKIAKKPGLRFLNYNGHFRNGSRWESKGYWGTLDERNGRLLSDIFGIAAPREEVAKLAEAFEKGEALPEPIKIGSSTSFQCTYCGKRLKLGFDGVSLHILGEPCARPEGLPFTEFELNVPSGRIAVDDDLRQWFPINSDPDINTLLGQSAWTKAYAATGLALGSIGNTCPSVWKDEAGKFRVASYHEEIYDEEAEEDKPNPEPNTFGEAVASVCTDLWAYSICDVDELQRRMDHYTPGETVAKWEEHWTHHIVDIRPGVYRFRHYHDIDRDGDTVVFADFEWVREPDPIIDYLGADKKLSNVATECLIQHALDWPTLYMPPKKGGGHEDRLAWNECSLAQKTASLARAADHVMCVLGGGVEWHENGFPRGEVSEQARTYARELAAELGLPLGVVPSFNDTSWMREHAKDLKQEMGDFLEPSERKFHWYPISPGLGGLSIGSGVEATTPYGSEPRMGKKPATRFVPSFVLLGLNICQHMLQHPAKPDLNTNVWPPRYGIEYVRKRMQTALLCYRGFRKHYPELVFDAEFDAWVMSGELTKGQKVRLVAPEGKRFVETTGALHEDDSRFLDRGLLGVLHRDESLHTMILRHFAKQYDVWRFTPDSNGYCVKSKDYRSLNGPVEIEVKCVIARGPMKGWVEGYYRPTKGRRTLLRVPPEMIEAGGPEAHIKNVDLGPVHPPKEKWGPRPPVFEAGEKHRFVEFDAAKMKGQGHLAWHPRNPGVAGCWANPKDAQRYALKTKGLQDFWSCHAGTSVPLKFVARITGTGKDGNPILLVEFDYGSDQMFGEAAKSWAIDNSEISACRFFDDEAEYQALLPAMTKVYTDMETLIEEKRVEYDAQIEKYRAEAEAKKVPTGGSSEEARGD